MFHNVNSFCGVHENKRFGRATDLITEHKVSFSPTQFIKVRFGAVVLQNRTHHPGFQEGGPLVDEAALPSGVILQTKATDGNSDPRVKEWIYSDAYRTHSGHHGVDVFSVPLVIC